MYLNITDTAAHTIYTGSIKKALITVNTGFTGTLTITDNSATPVAVITNPATGARYEYWVLNGIIVTCSATPDITVNLDLSRLGTAQ